MPKTNKDTIAEDNGGTRLRKERRQNQESERNPDRRSGRDRRKGHDRRSGLGRRRHQNGKPVERRDIFRDQDQDQ